MPSAYGMLTFAPGETSKTANVTIHNDTIDEINETFQLNLTTGSGATLADGQGIATIIDNDGPTISINDVTVAEAAGTATFTVILSAASPQDITVANVTTDDTALSGSTKDYAAASGTLTFTAGQTSKTVSVTINDDSLDEPNESFHVNLD